MPLPPGGGRCGALWRLESGGAHHLEPVVALTDVALSNGLAWSPGGETLYFVDTLTQRIDAYDVTAAGLGQRRTLADVAPADGVPDGLAVDAEGGVWVALAGGGALRRYAPSGELLEEVALPVSASHQLHLRRPRPLAVVRHNLADGACRRCYRRVGGTAAAPQRRGRRATQCGDADGAPALSSHKRPGGQLDAIGAPAADPPGESRGCASPTELPGDGVARLLNPGQVSLEDPERGDGPEGRHGDARDHRSVDAEDGHGYAVDVVLRLTVIHRPAPTRTERTRAERDGSVSVVEVNRWNAQSSMAASLGFFGA